MFFSFSPILLILYLFFCLTVFAVDYVSSCLKTRVFSLSSFGSFYFQSLQFSILPSKFKILTFHSLKLSGKLPAAPLLLFNQTSFFLLYFLSNSLAFFVRPEKLQPTNPNTHTQQTNTETASLDLNPHSSILCFFF